MSARALSGAVITPQDAAIAGKLARTFVIQAEGLAKLRGRRPSTRQTITVRQEKHLHTHQHVHMHGGENENGGQPHAKESDALVAALLGHEPTGEAVSLSGGKRKEGVPDARRQKPRSTQGTC